MKVVGHTISSTVIGLAVLSSTVIGTAASTCLAEKLDPSDQQGLDLSTRLMQVTYKLRNPKSTATGFLLWHADSQPVQQEPVEQEQDKKRQVKQGQVKTGFVLVTAHHVLMQMEGDRFTIRFRKKASEGTYETRTVEFVHRKDGRPLWTRHPSQDVAVLRVQIPEGIRVPRVPSDWLATDKQLKKYRIHPGDQLLSLGYPHAAQFQANAADFPVVRGGTLASFPILPTKTTKTFLMDMNSFEGHSGGVVYLSQGNRWFGGKIHPQPVQLILGLVVGQHMVNEKYQLVYASGRITRRLGLAIVVHATAIRETLAAMP